MNRAELLKQIETLNEEDQKTIAENLEEEIKQELIKIEILKRLQLNLMLRKK